MKRKTLTTAVVAGLAGIAGIASVANAVHVNPDGTGQVLIYPYYVARGGNTSLFTVVNTTTAVKAIKVRFIEGENSREVLDFNLYMSPFDVWTWSVTETANGAEFGTADNSCTVPYFFGEGGTFGSFGFSGALTAGDSGRSTGDRLREGYIELIEAGEVVGPIGANAIHGGNGVDGNGNLQPFDCNALVSAWSVVGGIPGIWVTNANDQMGPPGGGLFGDAVVINVAGARAFGYDPVALESFYVPGPLDPVSLHTDPANLFPSLSQALPATSYVVLGTQTASPVTVSDTWTSATVLPISAVLMTDEIMNTYATEADINGKTEWVVTFPTKRPHVWPPSGLLGAPFTSTFDEPATNQGDGEACEPFVFSLWDRNEQSPSISTLPIPSPGEQTGADPELCYEVNVVTFNNSVASSGSFGNEAGDIASDVLASRLFLNFDTVSNLGFDTGWAKIGFNGPTQVPGGPPIVHQLQNPQSLRIYQGLPAAGFAVKAADAGSFQFGAKHDHKYTRVITQG